MLRKDLRKLDNPDPFIDKNFRPVLCKQFFKNMERKRKGRLRENFGKCFCKHWGNVKKFLSKWSENFENILQNCWINFYKRFWEYERGTFGKFWAIFEQILKKILCKKCRIILINIWKILSKFRKKFEKVCKFPEVYGKFD